MNADSGQTEHRLQQRPNMLLALNTQRFFCQCTTIQEHRDALDRSSAQRDDTLELPNTNIDKRSLPRIESIQIQVVDVANFVAQPLKI